MSKKHIQSESTRAAIITAAGQLFMKQGYDATSMQHIAERCGVTKGALYHHFPSKDAILEAMCAHHYEGQQAVFVPIIEDASLSAVDKFTHIVIALRRHDQENSSFFNTYLRMHASRDPSYLPLKGRMKSYRRAMYLRYIAPILEQGREEGTFAFPLDAAMMAECLVQLEDYLTEEMARVVHQPVGDPEQGMIDLMEAMAFVYSRLLGADIAVFRSILWFEEGVRHYMRTLEPDGEVD